MSDKKSGSFSYEEAYRRLVAQYLMRLRNGAELLNGFMKQDFADIGREDLIGLKHLAHGFAGSGAAFGFDEVTEKAAVLEQFLIENARSGPLKPEAFDGFGQAVSALHQACAAGAGQVHAPGMEGKAAPNPPQGHKAVVIDDDPDVLRF